MFVQFAMVGKCCVTQFNTCSWLARFNIDLSKWFFINKLIVPKFMFMNRASNQQINNIGWDIINAKPNVELMWSYSNYLFHYIKKWIPMLGFTEVSLEPMWESTWHLLSWLFGMYTHLLKIFLSWGTFKQCKVHPKWTYNYDINNYFQCLRL